MSAVEQERAWWDAAAALGEQQAISVIAADEDAWTGHQLQRCLNLILPALPQLRYPSVRCLDLGCGIGRLTIPIAQRYPHATLIGVDISEHMIELAERRTPPNTKITWLVGDGRTLPPQVAPIHAAFSMITFQHIPRDAVADYIKQVAEALLPGGIFRFQVQEGDAAGFLGHQVTEAWVHAACATAGLTVIEYARLPALNDGTISCPWVTAWKQDKRKRP